MHIYVDESGDLGWNSRSSAVDAKFEHGRSEYLDAEGLDVEVRTLYFPK